MFVISEDSQLWWFIPYMLITLLYVVSSDLAEFNLYDS